MIQQPHFLFFSQRVIRSLVLVVFLSQLANIAIVVFDVSPPESFVLTQESEEPKPMEGKNAFDFLEDSMFIMANFPVFIFFSDENLNNFHKENLFFEVANTLDSPPPEVV